MNTDRLLELADAVKALDPKRFAMEVFLDTSEDYPLDGEGEEVPICDTVCCIAGHAVAIWAPEEFARHCVVQDGVLDDDNDFYPLAKRLLDLTNRQADQLFLARHPDGAIGPNLDRIKKRHAVEALRAMAMHGYINWDQILDDTETCAPA